MCNLSHTSLTLLFEHADFLIVEKPIGITMHDPQRGIIPLVKAAFSEPNLYLVHRLDDGTSGCLILAKTASSAAYFERLFKHHEVQKYYLALLSKKPQKKQGRIVGDMKNRRNGQHILLKTRENPAITQFFSFGLEAGFRVAVAKPLSGKTHQIRVAMKSLGSPILGDALYGGMAADRCYLHAWSLCFNYKGEAIQVFSKPHQGEQFTSSPFLKWLASTPSPNSLHWPTYGPRR